MLCRSLHTIGSVLCTLLNPFSDCLYLCICERCIAFRRHFPTVDFQENLALEWLAGNDTFPLHDVLVRIQHQSFLMRFGIVAATLGAATLENR